MSPIVIAACTGASIARAELFAGPIIQAMKAYGISETPVRMGMFLANVGVESDYLETTRENMNYRASALILKFGRHRISVEDANKFGRTETQRANQEAIANCIYGGPWGAKSLGNTQRGDGWKFRGAGLFQTTGRANVVKVRDRLRRKFPDLKVPDFEVEPEKLTEPLWAALSAGDYWDMRDLGMYADANKFDTVCDLLNIGKPTEKEGDAHGYDKRVALFAKATLALRLA